MAPTSATAVEAKTYRVIVAGDGLLLLPAAPSAVVPLLFPEKEEDAQSNKRLKKDDPISVAVSVVDDDAPAEVVGDEGDDDDFFLLRMDFFVLSWCNSACFLTHPVASVKACLLMKSTTNLGTQLNMLTSTE